MFILWVDKSLQIVVKMFRFFLLLFYKMPGRTSCAPSGKRYANPYELWYHSGSRCLEPLPFNTRTQYCSHYYGITYNTVAVVLLWAYSFTRGFATKELLWYISRQSNLIIKITSITCSIFVHYGDKRPVANWTIWLTTSNAYLADTRNSFYWTRISIFYVFSWSRRQVIRIW